MGVPEELAKLAELHRSGALTDAEFADAKSRVLNSPGGSVSLPQSGQKPKSQGAPPQRGCGVPIVVTMVFLPILFIVTQMFLGGWRLFQGQALLGDVSTGHYVGMAFLAAICLSPVAAYAGVMLLWYYSGDE